MKNSFFPSLTSYILSLISFLSLASFPAFAQQGEWAWMKGFNGYNGIAVYGTMGIPDTNNTPPALYEPAEWKDLQGRLWFFGGLSNADNNALWMYDKQTDSWTWEGGSDVSGQPGIYGTKGIPSTSNCPGARAWGVPTWVDHDGNLWLFGGYGYDAFGSYGVLNDLWRYTISTQEWTWISGSNLNGEIGIYGTQGVPNSNNTPGRRYECNTSWVDDSNALWLFGGFNGVGTWNDLWRFNSGTNEWTWMKGANYSGQPGVYGALGVPSGSNVPGGRAAYCKWRDTQNNFWMFGGYDLTGSTLNDLWKYDPSTNEWTWMSGTNSLNDQGTYSSICDSATSNFPKSRFENRACWTDQEGKFWLFGGTNDGGGTYTYNDLWYYKPSTNEWTWASGSSGPNSSGIYGTKGIASPNNYPPSSFGSIAWIDDSCNLWLFGGTHTWSFEKLNTLWKYTPGCGACVLTVTNVSSANFSATDTTLCEKFCINYFDSSLNNPVSWQWIFPGGAPASSTDQNPSNVCYQNPGVFDVTLIVTDSNGNSDTLTLTNYITVYTNPFAPVITQNGNTLSSSFAEFYQWQLNSTDIPGATNQSYTITQSGLYTVVIGDDNGCSAQSSVDASFVGIESVEEIFFMNIFPNPTGGNFIVEFSCADLVSNERENGFLKITVVNTLGQKVFSDDWFTGPLSEKKQIDLTNMPGGVYFIQLSSELLSEKAENILFRRKIVID